MAAIVGEAPTIWQADEVEICPGSVPGLGLDGAIRPAPSVEDVLAQTPVSTEKRCDGDTGVSCLDIWRACKAEGRFTDCIVVQTPGGGTNGADCSCGARRPTA